MKKVISSAVPLALLDDVASDKYYGVVTNKQKTFITRENFGLGYFYVARLDEMTNGNRFGDFHDNCLDTLILMLMDDSYEVYEFDTAKDLFKWLAKD